MIGNKLFKVAPGRRVWSNKHRKYFEAGEVIDLSHASNADIAAVVASGAIVEYQEAKPEKETVSPGFSSKENQP